MSCYTLSCSLLIFPHAKEDNNNSSHIMRYYWYVSLLEEFACHVTLSPAGLRRGLLCLYKKG